MVSTERERAMDEVDDLLETVRRKGGRLWLEKGQLRYRVPRDVLTEAQVRILRASKQKIVDSLQGAGRTSVSGLERPQLIGTAPLAFSQLAHWNMYNLGNRPAVRQIASATRMGGPLRLDALKRCITEIIRRHDALRTTIVMLDGVPAQKITCSTDFDLHFYDLTELPERDRATEVHGLIEQLILEPIDVGVGPLFGVRLAKVWDDEYVLVLAMEHIISDAFSMGILMRELVAAYMQAEKGRAVSLPAVPIQFSDYASWQRNGERSWVAKHGVYWKEHLAGRQRLRFPDDKVQVAETSIGWRSAPIRIGRSLKAELQEWCRRRRTTPAMAVFTAYVALVMQWCNTEDAVIRYQSNGRVAPELEGTIGFFASVLYLRIVLDKRDTFADLMNRVLEEYCCAYEHADSSYMAAQDARPGFTRNPSFNWVPQGSSTNFSVSEGLRSDLSFSPISFAHPMLRNLQLDHEPTILFYDGEEEIVGSVDFPANRFSIERMETFGRNLLVMIRALLENPESRITDVAPL